MAKHKPYCPWNGCGRPNGAARPVEVICICGTRATNFTKYCKNCGKCLSCKRIIKKLYTGN